MKYLDLFNNLGCLAAAYIGFVAAFVASKMNNIWLAGFFTLGGICWCLCPIMDMIKQKTNN